MIEPAATVRCPLCNGYPHPDGKCDRGLTPESSSPQNQPTLAVPGAQGQNVTGPAPVDFAGLLAALEESVRLQSHYAGLLNMHDGGSRLQFASAEKWIARLIVVGILKPAKSPVDWDKRAAILHDEVHQVAALVDAHTHVEIGWAPEDAILMLAEALREAYEEGRRVR